MQFTLVLSYTFKQLWNDSASFALWQAILIPTVLFICNLVIAVAISYAIWDNAIEILFPNIIFNTRLERYSTPEKIWLCKIIKEQKDKRKVVWFYWIIYIINLMDAALIPLSWIASIITCGSGWALCCLLIIPINISLGSAGILFILNLLFVPSERDRNFKK